MKTFLSIISLCLINLCAWGETLVNDSLQLEQVVVTGTRTPKLLSNSPIQTRVISAHALERIDATNIQDLLTQEIPGVEFSYSMSQLTHMNFSGFGGQSVLFLVDGERLAGETMDDVDFTRLNMANMDHIEIIKGAASALYGCNAAGGVINIITKTPTKPWTLNISGRIANHHNNRYSMSFGLNGKRVQNMLTFIGTHIDSYDVVNGDKNLAQTKYMVDTYYGDKTYNVNDKLTWKPVDNLRLSFKAGYFFRERATTAENEPDHYRDLNMGVNALWNMTSKDNLELSYNFDQYDKAKHFLNSDRCQKNYSNVQNSVRALYNHTFNKDNTLTIGGDFMRDYLFNSKTLEDRYSQNTADLFVQYDWNINKRWELVSALRYDYISEGKISRVSPKINVRYLATDDLTLRAGYGMGFRTPTLKERYNIFTIVGIWDIVGCNIMGNELKPETSHNINLSAEWKNHGFIYTLSTYYNYILNHITTGLPLPKSAFPGDKSLIGSMLWLPYTNIDKYQCYGLDFNVQKRWQNGIGAKASYAYVHEVQPKNDEGITLNNQYKPARPHAINLSVDWDKQVNRNYGVNICLSGRYLSSVNNIEYTDYVTTDPSTGRLASTEVHYNAYSIWKLQIAQRFHKAVKLTFTLDNILNYNPTYHYFNSPFTDGISVLGGLSIDIDKL